eukprot:scaffold80923_cov69-Phaeocystis_antarctica.AAC.1
MPRLIYDLRLITVSLRLPRSPCARARVTGDRGCVACAYGPGVSHLSRIGMGCSRDVFSLSVFDRKSHHLVARRL